MVIGEVGERTEARGVVASFGEVCHAGDLGQARGRVSDVGTERRDQR